MCRNCREPFGLLKRFGIPVAYYILLARNNDHRDMIVGGCCLCLEKNSGYQRLLFDHHGPLVGTCSDHFDIADDHYNAPFDNRDVSDYHYNLQM